MCLGRKKRVAGEEGVEKKVILGVSSYVPENP